MIKQVALLTCAVLTFSCHAWSQDTEVPKSKVFGIELGSNISTYKNATLVEGTGSLRGYAIPKKDFAVPPLFSEDFTFQAIVKEDGTILGILVRTNKSTENSSKVVDAIVEAYPQVEKDSIGFNDLARGEIGLGYTIIVTRTLFPPTLNVACAHRPTLLKLEAEEKKKNAKGL